MLKIENRYKIFIGIPTVLWIINSVIFILEDYLFDSSQIIDFFGIIIVISALIYPLVLVLLTPVGIVRALKVRAYIWVMIGVFLLLIFTYYLYVSNITHDIGISIGNMYIPEELIKELFF